MFLSCAPDWESNRHFWYTVWWYIVGFLAPLAVIIWTSVKTIKTIASVRIIRPICVFSAIIGQATIILVFPEAV